MKKYITHPLWTHLPILLLLAYLAVRLATAGTLPAEAPTHFGINGQPDAWGSPWLSFGILIGIIVLFGCISIILDEAWVRSEKRKSFNWMSLFDEVTAGCLTGISVGYLRLVISGETTLSFPWGDFLITAGITILLGVLVEKLRPFRPNPQSFTSEDTTELRRELRQRLSDNRVFMYWQSQNPLWVNALSVALPVIFLVLVVVMWFNQPWLSLLYLVLAAALSLMYGGMRTIVTRDTIVVRLGLFGIRVLKIRTAEIVETEIMEFSPIKDFGGYGIRFNRKMYAYFLRGNRGIKITLRPGVQYLIGSDHPDQMLAVIQAVAGRG